MHETSLAEWKLPIQPFLTGLAERCFEVRVGQDFDAAQVTKRAKIASPEPGRGDAGNQTRPRRKHVSSGSHVLWSGERMAEGTIKKYFFSIEGEQLYW